MDLSHKNLRKIVLTMAYKSQSGHIGCALSIIPILSDIFSRIGKDDIFILSKGHGVMALYAVYLETGKIKQEQLDEYLKDGTNLHGLAEFDIAGVSSGSLGHGLPVAVGIALAKKVRGEPGTVYCLVGDGEMQEGSCYEAMSFAIMHNLTGPSFLDPKISVFVDKNNLQAMGQTKDLSIYTEWAGCQEVETIKGLGVSFMEHNNEWHYKRLTKELYEQAMREQE